jgi:hypothetical protein
MIGTDRIELENVPVEDRNSAFSTLQVKTIMTTYYKSNPSLDKY